MRLKKSSSYSPSLTALSATSARIGLTEGGNFPLTSHDSVDWSVTRNGDGYHATHLSK